MKKILVSLALLLVIGVTAAVAVSWNGVTYTASAPTGPVVGQLTGSGTYNRGTTSYTRVQARLLKNGVQRGVIGTYGVPNANTTYSVTHRVTCSGIQYGTWTTQIRPVRTDGFAGPWVTSPGAYRNCG